MVSVFPLTNHSERAISRDYKLNSPNVVKQAHLIQGCLPVIQSTGGTSLENSRPENTRNRKKMHLKQKPHLWPIYLTTKSLLSGKSANI